MFNGQALKDFEKWYNKSNILCFNCIEYDAGDSSGYMYIDLDNFYRLSPSMQSGVYLEWLRSVGIVVTVSISIRSASYSYDIWDIKAIRPNNVFCKQGYTFTDYNTALTEAITKAGEIYNGIPT